jgi:holliday junction DNA helicase RuvA
LFAYLRGTIQSKEITGGPSDLVVLELSGVGFEVHVAHRTLLNLGSVGEEITLATSLAIRENEWTIFGFATKSEKELFVLLQSVTGIGPRLALGLIGTFTPQELSQAICDENQKLITQAPGVGAKVAQRIILELKSRVESWQERYRQPGLDDGEKASPVSEEVRIILSGLGYTATEVALALNEARGAEIDQDVESLVRFSLKALGSPAPV